MRAHFQLFCKCFGVVLMVGALLAALTPILTALVLPILTWEFHFGGFMGFVKTIWRVILYTIVIAAVPGGLGFYLTSEDNIFVRMCFPDGAGAPLVQPPVGLAPRV